MKHRPEEILFNQDGCRIEVVTPSRIGSMGYWPKQYIHFTDHQRDADSIRRSGFTLKYCGRSAKNHGVSDRYRFDPCGVYAIESEGFHSASQPYVMFKAYIETALYYNQRDLKLGSLCGKQMISMLYGDKAGRPLRTALMNDGIEALFSDVEMIILNTGLIEILK